jgi:CRISPR-associated protein Cmr6
MTRRERLAQIRYTQSVHAGLWLDKYIQNAKKGSSRGHGREEKPERSVLVGEIVQLKPTNTEGYKIFFYNWRKSLLALGARECVARTNSHNRMAVGLGADGVLETSIALHRTWGVPYIPGSALKGLAASYAHKHMGGDWQNGEALHQEFFGDADSIKQRGIITFFDALPDPESEKNPCQLLEDVMTPHHSDYYGGKANPPADWDKPIPVSFISAKGNFQVFLAAMVLVQPEASKEQLEQAKAEALQNVEVAHAILKAALQNEGIGAKTSSGYGRLLLGKLIEPTKAIKSESEKPQEPPQNSTPPENPNNVLARASLQEVIDNGNPLRLNQFLKDPGQFIPAFLNLKPDHDVRLEVAQGWRNLLTVEMARKQHQKALEKRKEGKTHWFDELRLLLGESI